MQLLRIHRVEVMMKITLKVYAFYLDVILDLVVEQERDIELGSEEGSVVEDASSEEEEVIEKGYTAADDFFLHPEVRGKLAGHDTVLEGADKDWALLSLDGKVIRRHQSDGSRYDSLAIQSKSGAVAGDEVSVLQSVKKSMKADRSRKSEAPSVTRAQMPSTKYIGKDGSRVATDLLPLFSVKHKSPSKQSFANAPMDNEWPPLDSEKEMESYSVAMVQDPAQKRKVIPSEIVRSKLRYLMYEVLDGFSHADRWSFDFYIALILMFSALWIRMFIHYLGEYMVLQALVVPVFGFTVYPYEISFRYLSSGITVGSEVLVVAAGPIWNIIFFLLLELCSVFIFKVHKMSYIYHALILIHMSVVCRTSPRKCIQVCCRVRVLHCS